VKFEIWDPCFATFFLPSAYYNSLKFSTQNPR
jgi:hypothetical protein